MLQELIKDLQSTLSNYNQGLAKQNLLVDNPWTMVDGDLNLQRLIFKKDQSLYIVKEGEIQESKWEYLPRVKSIVIEIGGRKILMNEVFADEKALILKKDGNTIDFLAFANQEKLPDLNLIGYLTSLDKKQIEEPTIDDPYKYPGSKPLGCASVFLVFLIAISILLTL